MDDTTDPIANMVRGARYLHERLPEWFDENYSVWVDSSNQARRAKENNMSKKINAGDTLTVGDLTDAHLGAVIEVGPTDGGITCRFRLDRIECYGTSQVKMLTTEGGAKHADLGERAKVITPPPAWIPPMEARLMIEPPPFLRMVRATDFMPRKHPSWLTRNSSSNSSTGWP